MCTDIWIIEAGSLKPGGEGGTVRKWKGEFEEYRDMLAEELSKVRASYLATFLPRH